MPISLIETVLVPALRSSPGTFAATMEAWMVAHPTWTAELNAIVADINAASGFVGAAMADRWVSGTTYDDEVLVFSPINYLTYRRIGDGAGTDDPSIDPDHWAMWQFATQADAETGTNNTKMMTALRVAQRITSLLATQTIMEAATSTVALVTAGSVNWHPGVAKAWLKCDIAGSVIVSHNITSIIDNTTGSVSVNLATDFSSAHYVVSATPIGVGSAASILRCYSQNAGTFTIKSEGVDDLANDPSGYLIVCFGDQ